MSSGRIVGLYEVRRRRRRKVSLEELLEPPTAHAALGDWLEDTAERCRAIRRKFPRSSHAKLALIALKEIPRLLALIDDAEAVKRDPYALALEMVQHADRVQRINHNLALAATVEGRRKSARALKDHRHKGESKVPEVRQRRIAQAATLPGADIGALARENGISKGTLFRWRKKYFPRQRQL